MTRLLSCLLTAVLMALAPPALAADGDLRVLRINDHLLGFYDGRPPEPKAPPARRLWPDTGANDVGVATYAIHQGDSALVYDAYPDVRRARQVRRYLEQLGVRRFTLVNSHWHLDHVGGNAVYADSPRIATARTQQILREKRAGIEAGTEWGPPAITPLALPTIGISGETTVMIGTLRAELRPVAIHSADSLVLVLPDDGIMLAGDTLEDTVTFVAEPETLVAQYAALGAMRRWGITHILPNHGDPAVLARGGYPLALIDFTRGYIRHLVEQSHDAGFTSRPLDSFVKDGMAAGTISLWWAYREAHQSNLDKVAAAWRDRPLPAFDPAD